jgi:hypothetical protein
MADILGFAQDIYDAALDEDGVPNDAEIESLRTDLRTLIAAQRSGTTTGTLTSASKNGVAYTQQPDMSPSDRRAAMSWALKGLQNSTRPSSTAYVRF